MEAVWDLVRRVWRTDESSGKGIGVTRMKGGTPTSIYYLHWIVVT